MERKEKPLVGKTFEEIKDIQKKYQDELLGWSFIGTLKHWFKGYPKFNGVGIGFGETEESLYYFIKLYLPYEPIPKRLGKIPKNIDGVPIKYEIIGEIIAG